MTSKWSMSSQPLCLRLISRHSAPVDVPGRPDQNPSAIAFNYNAVPQAMQVVRFSLFLAPHAQMRASRSARPTMWTADRTIMFLFSSIWGADGPIIRLARVRVRVV